MYAGMKQAQIKTATADGSPVLAFLRQHPLWGYFLLTFGFSWGWQIPLFALAHQVVLGPWLILGPSLAGCVMAGVTEGRAGLVRLLRRVLLWRAGLLWYLVALLILPAVWLASVALMPGAGAAFQPPDAAFLLTYAGAFVYAFFAALVVEEVGWRGFALLRLQGQYGPLLGTLILGALWALWHLPSWAFFPSLTGAGTSVFSGTFVSTFLGFACMTTASAIFYTWVFNHSRGSILLALLLHASANATGNSFLALFPSLFPQPVIPAAYEIGVVVLAVLVVVATQGRLGYEHYRQEVSVPAPSPGVPQPASARP